MHDSVREKGSVMYRTSFTVLLVPFVAIVFAACSADRAASTRPSPVGDEEPGVPAELPVFEKRSEGFEARTERYAVSVNRDAIVLVPHRHAQPIEQPPSGFRLSTERIQRGAHRYDSNGSPARVQADGRVAIDRGEATEHLRLDRTQIEQSWLFTALPPGSGDLD